MKRTAKTASPAAAPAGFSPYSIFLKGASVQGKIGQVAIGKLRFYAKNPRVYSLVHSSSGAPTQEEIEDALLKADHVKALIQEIREAGGLIEPLYVRDNSFDVLEGNSRVAALRFLSRKNPIKWASAQCVVLPSTISDSQVSALLSRFHLIGKTQWPPYEKAGHLYRRYREDGCSLDDIVSETGLTKSAVVKTVDAFEMMLRHKDRRRERWSYYQEFVRSSIISKACKEQAALEEVVVQMIKSGEIQTAVALRDQLPIICKAGAKTLKRFVDGKLNFEDALAEARTGGADDRSLGRLKSFRKWLALRDNQDVVTAAQGTLRVNVCFEVQQLKKLILNMEKKLAQR